jgi:phosphotransferase system HPr (HPr) family protein
LNFDEKDLTPAELKAIHDHKYFMALELGKDVTINEAIEDFLEKYRDEWRKEKNRRDNLDQLREINKHKYLRSKEEGRDLGEEAIEEWREKYAEIWRQERESLKRHGFLTRKIRINNERGLHVRPSGTLVGIAREYNCEIYIHKEGMDHYNFAIDGKPYLNVKSVLAALDLVGMCANMGDELEFLSYGEQAKEALDKIEKWVENKFGETK